MNKMNYLGILGLAVLYAVTAFAVAFLGFLSPYAWVFFPVIAALLGAFSYYWAAKRWQKFGVATLCSFVLAAFLLAVGEFEVMEFLLMLAVGIASDVVRQLVGNEKQESIYVAYPLLPIGLIAWTLPLWTRTQWYYNGAAEELGVEYAKGLMTFSSVWGLLLVVLTTAISGFVGIQLVAKVQR